MLAGREQTLGAATSIAGYPLLTTIMSQAEDMAAARAGTTIDVEAVKYYLWNGKDEWDRHSRLVQIISNDPVFDKSRKPHMARTERYKRGLAITKRLVELRDIYNWSDKDMQTAFGITDEGSSWNVHNLAFVPVILSQGSSEQVESYGIPGSACAILGSYAQTELGHGSQVANLETTATFIPETRQFELHTPRLQSYKWWIGGLGKFATHCVVQARLILPEGDKGVHLFMLQIRSLDGHNILPGITLGDIGPKAFGAVPSTDNGFMRLDRVRVPLSAMLSRFASVTDQGEYKTPVHSKLSYGGMIYIRSTMVTSSGWLTAKAATIAIRYATVRRQGNGTLGAERQVITYPSVYHRLLPILSRAYAWIFLGQGMLRLYREMSSLLSNQSTTLLAETHAVSSGLKVLVASLTSADLETARRSMGGHGYSAAAGIGTMWANWVPANTYEGDNYVLAQQVVRASLKSLQSLVSSSDKVEASKALPPSMHFLRLLFSPAPTSTSTWTSAEAIHLLELRGAYMVQEHAHRVKENIQDGGADWRVSRAVAEAFVAPRIGEIIVQVEETMGKSKAAIISALLRLYLLSTIEAALVDLMSFDLIPHISPPGTKSTGQTWGVKGTQSMTPTVRDSTCSLRTEISRLENEILPQAIGLTDAFGFTDWELDSALGVKDGRAYEALWERAQLEPLNATDVPDGYEEYIKPILERGRKLLERQKAKL